MRANIDALIKRLIRDVQPGQPLALA
jgi:hypothetical protein